jgi:hypothetical protein
VPQVIALALLGAGLYAGYRWLARTVGGLGPTIAGDARPHQSHSQSEGRIEKDLGALEWDPAVGVYRPAKRN